MADQVANTADYVSSNYETPFSDSAFRNETADSQTEIQSDQFVQSVNSPFNLTYEVLSGSPSTPFASEYVQLLAELNDNEFPNVLYNMANEIEDGWTSRIAGETRTEQFYPFAKQNADRYISNVLNETDRVMDLVSNRFSGNNPFKITDSEVEEFFQNLDINHDSLTPAQDQFLGSLFNKVKSAVKSGINLAKKGADLLGKLNPVNILLGKLKGLVRPLLNRVLQFALGKLPPSLQPYAQQLANRFLNQEVNATSDNTGNEISTTGDLEAVQTEFDHNIGKSIFSSEDGTQQNFSSDYEFAENASTNELNDSEDPLSNLQEAREQFIQRLQNLAPGESAAPAIEQFLPLIMAAKPLIKMAIGMIGRPRIINFLAGILAKLVGTYIPSNVATPLSAKIIDLGMNTIGFETSEKNSPDLGYEAIANTIEETVQNLLQQNETSLDNQEDISAQLLNAFETAAANNFPSQYIKPELRTSTSPGVWIMMPRNAERPCYKKYSQVFSISIDPAVAKQVTGFRGIPLADFLRDKLGLDPTKTIQAKVHLYEAIDGTKLSRISKHEKVPGLGPRQLYGWYQLFPLTSMSAALLLKEPGLGRDFSSKHSLTRHRIAIGQRFYYLEIEGARLRIPMVHRRHHSSRHENELVQNEPSHSGDIQAVLNFITSEIRINYYFSEEEAISVIEKLNAKDFLGAALALRYSVKNVLRNLLIKNVSHKVKIIHEAMPELYLQNYAEPEEHFAGWSSLKNMIGGFTVNTGKKILKTVIEKLTGRLALSAEKSLLEFFKNKSEEFKKAQADPKDGVTARFEWKHVQGMSAINTVIHAIRGKLSIGSLSGFSLPEITVPEIQILAGKEFN